MSRAEVALIGAMLVAGALTRAVAAEPAAACGQGLPPSVLTFLDAKLAKVEEVVSTRELAAAKGKLGGHAADFLLGDPSVRGWLSVEHRQRS